MRNRRLFVREESFNSEPVSERVFANGRKLRTGLLAGLTAGLAATWVMTRYQINAQRLISRIRKESPPQGGESTTVTVANRVTRAVTGRELPPEWSSFAGNAVHYGFGASVGAIYGVLNKLLPAVSMGRGLAYGAAVWAAADELALPASGMAKWWPAYPVQVHAAALGAHLVYAATLDLGRRGIESALNLRAPQPQPESAYFRQPRAQHRASPTTRRFSRFGLETEREAA